MRCCSIQGAARLPCALIGSKISLGLEGTVNLDLDRAITPPAPDVHMGKRKQADDPQISEEAESEEETSVSEESSSEDVSEDNVDNVDHLKVSHQW